MISQYLKERAKWNKFGKPLRKPQKVETLFSICQQCPQFKKYSDEKGECSVCGCGLKKQGKFLNKLAWGTTRCPLPEPKWVEEDTRYSHEVSLTTQDLNAAEREHKQESAEENKPPIKGCGCK